MNQFKELTKSEKENLLQMLRDDIDERYNNEQYWDESIITDYYTSTSTEIGYCSYCLSPVADRLYLEGQGEAINWCTPCDASIPIWEVLDDLPKSEIRAQRADIYNENKKLGI